jgi:hypothetical protein
MADHNVTLHYSQNPDPTKKPLFQAEPNPIRVKKNHTISFKKSNASLPGTIRIRFQNPALFSAAVSDGTQDVTVVGDPIPTTYHCSLVDAAGNTLAESNETGGEILPGEVGLA